jgi:choice-of-anchor A domain-containing protein
MRIVKQFLVAMVAVGVMVAQRGALAAEPHSWCVAGAPLVQGGADAVTNLIISQVCTRPAFASCCAAGGRWGLSCVQTAAAFAKQNNLSGGDFCGRYQWAQGPLPGTQQAYPRDFNLFATAGRVSTLRDSDGPIAASAEVTVSSFHLNVKRQDPIALAAQGNITLYNGTINGSTLFGSSYSDTQVTYLGATRPSVRSTPFPIAFPTVTANLIAMSAALQRYDAILATKNATNVTFAGADPELNVFSIPASMLTGTTSYAFNVPSGSNVIVNVTGASPAFANAGVGGPVHPSRLLWNFPEATTLGLQSLGFVGSILAPKATATFQNGSLAGTVVVAAAASANIELYAAPYAVPSCVGGLCLDPTWSVSADVRLDDNGNAAQIRDEAGFLEIFASNYTGEAVQRRSPTHRVWYSFVPAKTEPKSRPLAIFFNGGPGSATSSILGAFNTGPRTLDPLVTGPNVRITTNAFNRDWSQFANLLYVDAPGTGFSYPITDENGGKPSVGIDMEREAGIFVSVLLRFLKRHPALLNNRVVIVGESYGGVRATYMLQHLYGYATLTNAASRYQDIQLDQEIRNYFVSVFGTNSPTALQIQSKFGHQILIDPVVVGELQTARPTAGGAFKFDATVCLSPTCMLTSPGQPQTCDPYNCDKPAGFSGNLGREAASRLTEITTLRGILGVDPTTIEWLKPPARVRAYGRNDGEIIAPINLEGALGGQVGVEDAYFVNFNDAVNRGYPGASTWGATGQGKIQGTDFVNHLRNNVSTMVTVAKFDTVVYSLDIPFALGNLRSDLDFGSLVANVRFSKTDPIFPTPLGRPGFIGIDYASPVETRTAAMPFQYVAGHSISMRAPAELLADAMIFFQSSPH